MTNENTIYGNAAMVFLVSAVMANSDLTRHPPPPPPPPPLYSDISSIRGEQLENIIYVTEQGLFEGSGGRFMPFDGITNAQFLAVLSRLSKAGLTEGPVWYEVYLKWAEDSAIASGVSPDALLTRQDMALWFYRCILLIGDDPPSVNAAHSFTDLDGLNSEYLTAIAAMYGWDIIRGTSPGTVFGKGQTSERVHIANILARYVRGL